MNRQSIEKKEFRWLAVSLVFLVVLGQVLLIRNTYYTEGEVVQGLYFLTCLMSVSIWIAAFWFPRYSLWSVVVFSLPLVLWQVKENRELVRLHEEVNRLIIHIEKSKNENGAYPLTAQGYQFEYLDYSDKIRYSLSNKGAEFHLMYFIDQSGISFWYDSDSGFGYYGD